MPMHNDHHVAPTLDVEESEGTRVSATVVLAATAAGKRDEAGEREEERMFYGLEGTSEYKGLPEVEEREVEMEMEVEAKAEVAVTH